MLTTTVTAMAPVLEKLQGSGERLSILQLTVLCMVANSRTMTRKEISRRLFLDYSMTSQVVTRVIEKGYIDLGPHPVLKHRNILLISNKGRILFAKLGIDLDEGKYIFVVVQDPSRAKRRAKLRILKAQLQKVRDESGGDPAAAE